MERRLPIQNLADFDAVCAGPGLGEGKESIDFVKELLISYEKTLIVDADGLNIIAHCGLFELLRRRADLYPEQTILTPHMGEARRLLETEDPACTAAPAAPEISAASGAGPAASAAARGRIAAALVQKTRAIIVLKGAGTLVAAEGRQTYTNTTGNPGMATAGSGDVLSGIITGLAGQRSQVGTGTALDFALGNPAGAVPDGTAVPGTEATAGQAAKPARIGAFEAALAGVYIHGLAGDLAARELGEYGVTAGDLALYTAYAMKKILSEV